MFIKACCDRVSCVPGWRHGCYVAEDDLHLLPGFHFLYSGIPGRHHYTRQDSGDISQRVSRNFVSLSLFENEVRGWFHGLQSLRHLLHHRRVKHIFTAHKFHNFALNLRAISSSFRHGFCCFIIHISNTSTKTNIFSIWAIYTMHLLIVLAINFQQGRDFSRTSGWQSSLSSHDPLFSQPASLPCTSCALGLRHATILDSAIFYLLLFL